MNGINKILPIIGLVILLLAILVITLPAFAVEKEVGKTLLTRGEVFANRANAKVPLKRRSIIFEKDEVHVGNEGRAQLRMIDQALISLQENSILQIKNYRFQKGRGDNSAILELLSGGLRTITGAIGKGNKKAYELRTPLATIGVRGTDYEVEIVNNGMFVAVWDGVIRLRAHLKSGCNMKIGRSQAYRFVFIDKSGRCKGLQQVPDVFTTGHSSGASFAGAGKIGGFVAGNGFFDKQLVIEPLRQSSPEQVISDLNNDTYTPDTPNPDTPLVEDLQFKAFTIDQSRSSTELVATSSSISSSAPTFTVGLNHFSNVIGGTVSNFQQSVGGFPLSWGYWGSFSSTLVEKNIDAPGAQSANGLIWAAYQSTDPSIVNSRSGTFHRYGNVTDSLLSSSAGLVSNLQIQMDVNFESGSVTNGAFSANTASETWVAVFDGTIQSGNLDIELNGASVINSDPATQSPPRDASGFIAGDFIGNNAEAIIGAFGLSEDNTSNHIEGVFVVEEVQQSAQ